VYSTLLFPFAIQTYYSEGEDGLEFFNEKFYAVLCPGCCSCRVIEPSTVLFRMRLILVFRYIIFVINILYSWHLIICEHFLSVCVEQLILGIHMMSTWFCLQNRVWQKWYQSCVNRRNASLDSSLFLSLILSICNIYIYIILISHLCFWFKISHFNDIYSGLPSLI
jgi:hypothetical protein